MSDSILVLNAGSSSIKFQLFAVQPGNGLERLLKGQFEGIGVKPHLVAKGPAGELLVEETWGAEAVPNVPAALEKVVGFLKQRLGGKLPSAIGHRVVHGGPKFSRPTVVTQELLAQLDPLIPLAPLHQPNNLAPIAPSASGYPIWFRWRASIPHSIAAIRSWQTASQSPSPFTKRACAGTASTVCHTSMSRTA